ncbi:MAG: lauroyl acyltransferase [Desulfobacterales bacterium]|nr:MAG: lauroyl acyltransferase [Desulfobacterales bacterium]
MNQNIVFLIGFLAQLLFSARQLTQWISSERAGKVLSPLLFWQLSVLASFLLMVYGILRNDLAIILGQMITYGVYLRNLYYFGFWRKLPKLIILIITIFPFIALALIWQGDSSNFQNLVSSEHIPPALLVWGIAGQFVFTFRFVYQLVLSEKRKESILPVGFWIISITGSIMVLSYAIIRKDPVLFAGQIFGVVVYSRNLLLGLRHQKAFRE